MLRAMLAGLDGTPDGDAVLRLGLRWARRYDALLVGIAIVDEPGVHGVDEWVLGETAYLQRLHRKDVHQATRRADQVLEVAALRCAEAGVSFKPLEVVGDPCTRILEEVHRYDMVLLGRATHFQFGFEKIDDDILSRILRRSPRPVVVVPRQEGPDQAVLVAFDGSLQASRAVQAFAASGLWRDRDIHVVSIAATHDTAARHAERAVDFLSLHEIRARPMPLASAESPAALILRLAAELSAGLIVMGSYGQPLMREVFLGSTTRAILKGTPAPLFVTH